MTLTHMGMSIPLTDTLQPANNRTKCAIATNARIATVAVANGFMDLPPCDEARHINTNRGQSEGAERSTSFYRRGLEDADRFRGAQGVLDKHLQGGDG